MDAIVLTKPAPPGASSSREMRRAPRRRSFLSRKLVFDQARACSLDCVIRDLSDTGARVRLNGGLPVPPVVHLVDLSHGVAYGARVLWRRGGEIGLAFDSVHPLDHADTASLRPMRRLWVEHLAR